MLFRDQKGKRERKKEPMRDHTLCWLFSLAGSTINLGVFLFRLNSNGSVDHRLTVLYWTISISDEGICHFLPL